MATWPRDPLSATPSSPRLIKQERLHNPNRTLLLTGGDNIQGDAMSYYFKSAPLGYAADGTPLRRSSRNNRWSLRSTR